MTTWTQLPATPQADAALRRAAAGVCGLRWSDTHRVWFLDRPGKLPELLDPWLPDQNRDDLSRVFAAARIGPPYWSLSLHDPRAALCALLDLLAIPVPPELEKEQ